MDGERLDPETLEGGKDAPKQKTRMVNVYNKHRYRSFHLGQGRKIAPGQSGRIPLAMFKKVKDTCTWLVRAERGDVI